MESVQAYQMLGAENIYNRDRSGTPQNFGHPQSHRCLDFNRINHYLLLLVR